MTWRSCAPFPPRNLPCLFMLAIWRSPPPTMTFASSVSRMGWWTRSGSLWIATPAALKALASSRCPQHHGDNRHCRTPRHGACGPYPHGQCSEAACPAPGAPPTPVVSPVCARRLPSGVAVAVVGGVSRQREARHSRTPPCVCAGAPRRTHLSVSPPSHSPTLCGGAEEERSAHQGRQALAIGRRRGRSARTWRPRRVSREAQPGPIHPGEARNGCAPFCWKPPV